MAGQENNAELVAGLKRAIEEGQIEPWFQPVMCPAGLRMLSAEALPRWEDPVKGVIPAGVFIAAAIAHDLLPAISKILLDKTCANFAEWRARGIAPSCVSVNLTGAELRSELSVDQIKWAMERHGLEPRDMAIEIAEEVMTEPGWEASLASVRRLRALGLPFWLDDFGAGPCDPDAIARVDFALTKVARAIVGKLDEDPDMAGRLKSLVTQAHAAGMEIIAKGVETRTQIDVLVAQGCNGQQGFAIARPMAPDAFAEWLDLNTLPEDLAEAG
ncbi:MAG: EAL domain-containing protein [Pikeienuella sp.]